MNKEQLKQRKEQIKSQANILKMVYDNVEIISYKLGLISCRMKNSSLRHLYKENEQIYSEYKIKSVVDSKYFIIIRLCGNSNGKSTSLRTEVTNTILLNRRTSEEIIRLNNNIHVDKTICNGKYLILHSIVPYTSKDKPAYYLFNANNNEFLVISYGGITELLETVLNKIGKGAFK